MLRQLLDVVLMLNLAWLVSALPAAGQNKNETGGTAAQNKSQTGITRLSKSSWRLDNDVVFEQQGKSRGVVRRRGKPVAALTCLCDLAPDVPAVDCALRRAGQVILCASGCAQGIACNGNDKSEVR